MVRSSRRPKVFIASDWQDRVLARALSKDIRSIADPLTLRQTQFTQKGRSHRLVELLDDAIRQSDAIVVLLSPHAESSPWLNQELGFARGLDKPIFVLASETSGEGVSGPSRSWRASMFDRKIYRSIDTLRADLAAQLGVSSESYTSRSEVKGPQFGAD